MKKYSRTYVSVDLGAVKQNMESMRRNVKADTEMIAVVKANAYGHGAGQVARVLEELDYIWGFAVATAEEAIELYDGGIRKPILILGYVFEEYYDELVSRDVRMAVFEYETAAAIAEHARSAGKTAKIHIAVDTGMTRIGVKDNEDGLKIVKDIRNLREIEVEGMFTHFARADETEKIYADRQFERYQSFRKLLSDEGILIPICHCSNSAGIIDMPYANLDLVRAGISIYGIYPSDEVEKEKVPLVPVMEWKAHISYVKEVAPGVQISYGGTFETERTTVVATIPVGYADGYPRLLSGKGYVLVNGQKAPILGRVCMDQFMVDVTDIEGVAKGDMVTLLGKDKDAYLPVEALSEICGRFPYEFVCNISRRVPRIYL